MQNKQNAVRIISGKYRSRRISFPDVDGLRPTHDRVRETLFNWLQQQIVGSNCLDLFAGSGALGFEAASRGAKQVTMVDSSRQVCDSLFANKKELEADQINIIQRKYSDIPIESFCLPFDIIFLDPPFYKNYIKDVLDWIAVNKLLVESSLVYVECSRQDEFILPEEFAIEKQGATKTIDYCLLRLLYPVC